MLMDNDLGFGYNLENPLDALEEMISLKHWPCSRSNRDELVAEIQSSLCPYRLYFSWSEDINVINFTITFDLKIPNIMKPQIYELLARINERLWIGHFDVTSKTGIPAYRNTFFLKDKSVENINFLEDLVDVGISECEKFYPSFQMVLWEEYSPSIAVSWCLMEVKGRA